VTIAERVSVSVFIVPVDVQAARIIVLAAKRINLEFMATSFT